VCRQNRTIGQFFFYCKQSVSVISHHSKLYFYDTGLASALLGIKETGQLQTPYLKGELFENFIFTEFLKYKHNHHSKVDFYFWRDNSGKEIDCIVEGILEQQAVEIKSARTIHPDFFRNLNYWKSLSGNENLFLIYGGSENYLRSGINVLNWKNCESLFGK